MLDIAIKHCPIDRPRQNQWRGDARPADDCQGRGLGSRGLRRRVHHALMGCRTPIQARQAQIDAGFIQKFEAFHIQLGDFFSKQAALPFHARRVALAGMERLFFRGNLSRTNSRYTPHLRWVQVSCSDRIGSSFPVPLAHTTPVRSHLAAPSPPHEWLLRRSPTCVTDPRCGAALHNYPLPVSALTSVQSRAH